MPNIDIEVGYDKKNEENQLVGRESTAMIEEDGATITYVIKRINK